MIGAAAQDTEALNARMDTTTRGAKLKMFILLPAKSRNEAAGPKPNQTSQRRISSRRGVTRCVAGKPATPRSVGAHQVGGAQVGQANALPQALHLAGAADGPETDPVQHLTIMDHGDQKSVV